MLNYEKRKSTEEDKMNVHYHNGVPHMPSKPVKEYRKVKKTIIVDSRDRVFSGGATNASGDLLPLNNDYFVQFPAPYKNVYSVKLKSAEIPYSFYTFNSQGLGGNITNVPNDCTGLNVNGVMTVSYGGTAYTVTLSNGNYTLSGDSSFPAAGGQFEAAVKAALDSTGGGATFTVSVNPATHRMTITSATAFQLMNAYDSNNRVTSNNTFWGLGYFLGFQKVNTTAGTSATGAYPVQLHPYNYILMEMDFINKYDETPLENKRSGNVDNVFAKIQLNSNAFTTIFDSEFSTFEQRSILNPPINKLQNIHVKWRHHDGTPVNFNNVEHSYTLELELLDTNFDEYSSLETA